MLLDDSVCPIWQRSSKLQSRSLCQGIYFSLEHNGCDTMEAEEENSHADSGAQPRSNGKQDGTISYEGEEIEGDRVWEAGNAEQHEHGENPVAADKPLAQIQQLTYPTVTLSNSLEPLRVLHAVSEKEDEIGADRLAGDGKDEDPAYRYPCIPEYGKLTGCRQDHRGADLVDKNQ